MSSQLILRPIDDPWHLLDEAIAAGQPSFQIWQRFKPLLPSITLEMVVMRRRALHPRHRRHRVSRRDWF